MVGRVTLLVAGVFVVGLAIAILSSIAAVTVPYDGVAVSEIRFRYSDSDSVQICVSNAADIESIVDTVRLREKGECMCIHVYEAAFVVEGNEKIARLCSGCFDFVGPDGGYFKMPERFYEVFLAYRDSTQLEESWSHADS